eukprot:gene12331-6005_t
MSQLKWSGGVYDNSYFGYHCNLVGQKMISKFDIKENMNVLDAGCGTGAITLELLKTFGEKINITSVDFSEDMVKTLEKKIPTENSSVQVLQSSLDDLNILKDNTFDVIFCNMVMFFVPDKQKAFSELKRVVKKGGKVLVSVWETPEKCDAMKFYFDLILTLKPNLNFKYVFDITDDDLLIKFCNDTPYESVKIHRTDTEVDGSNDEVFNLFINALKLLEYEDVERLKETYDKLKQTNGGTILKSKVVEYTK